MMNQKQKDELRELLKEFPFLKNIHFTKFAKVSNSSVNMFASGKRKSFPEIERFKKLCERVLNCI